jgi:hypothetical protein
MNKIWNSKKINDEIRKLESGEFADMTPFYEGNVNLRKADINFEYSKEEQEEFARCANDIIHFADRYAHAMTDAGIAKIELRPYQHEILKAFQENRYIALMSCRQAGKTITSSIFITWYLCFHFDRNILVIANKMTTSIEIVDKIKIVYQNLPFFLKPGVLSNGATGMKFDNGIRLFSQATTKTAALGFAIHLLYADEFAHIADNYIEPFYRSIYPTLSSSDISRIIISSTPNKMNLFHSIYAGAVAGTNEYFPLRVDWWQVPGRDEAWKKREVANLGSEEMFNQEYGNQFLSANSMLLSPSIASYLKRIKKKFIWKEIDVLEDIGDPYGELVWDPLFDLDNINMNTDRFVVAIDLADGVGNDYTVCNIFKLELQSKAIIRKTKIVENEGSFYRLRQIGMWRSNVFSIEDFSRVLEQIIYNIFGANITKIVLETNFKGNIIIDRLAKHQDYFPEIFMYTLHSTGAVIQKQGVRIRSDNKELYAREMKNLIRSRRLVLLEEKTYNELTVFGLNKQGKYEAQIGHDDISMTLVNLVSFYSNTAFFECVEDIHDMMNYDVRQLIEKQIGGFDVQDDLLENTRWLKEFM